jgi:hypothetical protein
MEQLVVARRRGGQGCRGSDGSSSKIELVVEVHVKQIEAL